MREPKIHRRTLLGATGLAAAPSLALAAANPRVAIKTGKGTIVVELEATRAPITVANFLHYVDTQKYDGGTFYRAARSVGAPTDGTIVGGLPKGGRPYPPIAHEPTTQTGLRHLAGTISLGRFAPGSATADFFICATPEPYLDAHPGTKPGVKGDVLGYAAFGQVVSGMGVVHAILASHTGKTAPFKDQKGQWLDPPIPILSMKRV